MSMVTRPSWSGMPWFPSGGIFGIRDQSWKLWFPLPIPTNPRCPIFSVGICLFGDLQLPGSGGWLGWGPGIIVISTPSNLAPIPTHHFPSRLAVMRPKRRRKDTENGRLDSGRDCRAICFKRRWLGDSIRLSTHPSYDPEPGLAFVLTKPLRNAYEKRPGMHSHAKRGNETVSDGPKPKPSPSFHLPSSPFPVTRSTPD